MFGSLALTWGQVLLFPGRLLSRLDDSGLRRAAICSAVLLGIGYAVLYRRLADGGYVPSMTKGLPFPAQAYYETASVYALPLVLVLTVIVCGCVWLVGGKLTTPQPFHRVWPSVSLAYTTPLLWAFILPDHIVLASAGFDAMGVGVRFYGAFAAALVFLRCAQVVRALFGCTWKGAVATAFVAAVVQGVPAALLLR